jgi:hypothetical protein
MNKTYESIYRYEDGREIIIARGSKDYVKSCAQMSQFVPYTIREFQTPENIRADYRDWRNENRNRKPNRVIVKMHWEDEPEKQLVDTIGIIPQSKIGNTENIPGDAIILYYVSGMEGLLELMKPNNGSDFVVDEVLEFYKK